MELTEKDKQQLLENFDDAIDALYSSVSDIYTMHIKALYKCYQVRIVNKYIKFINKQSGEKLSLYFKDIEKRQSDYSEDLKLVPLIEDALKLWNAKSKQICLLDENGKIEIKDDKLPDIEYGDDRDLPEADF